MCGRCYLRVWSRVEKTLPVWAPQMSKLNLIHLSFQKANLALEGVALAHIGVRDASGYDKCAPEPFAWRPSVGSLLSSIRIKNHCLLMGIWWPLYKMSLVGFHYRFHITSSPPLLALLGRLTRKAKNLMGHRDSNAHYLKRSSPQIGTEMCWQGSVYGNLPMLLLCIGTDSVGGNAPHWIRLSLWLYAN